ncbi:hypothetical protein V8C37DRAFT_417512 [Trichoderma ceciliae]
MAPSTITAAIREGEGITEAELCTSTSADVCELFNKGGITRVLGRPDIIELIYIPDEPERNQPRLHLFTRYLEETPGDSYWTEAPDGRNYSRSNDTGLVSNKSMDFAPKLNLSLNVGIKRQPDVVFYTVAAIGFILQSGILVFACAAAWLLDWNIEKLSSEASRNYVPGIFILAITLLMSVSRSVLRMQRLDKSDNLIQPPNKNDKRLAEWNNLVAGHELDWLAFEVSGKNSQKNYVWHITGKHEDARSIETKRQIKRGSHLFQNRVRLSHLTGNSSFKAIEAKDYISLG